MTLEATSYWRAPVQAHLNAGRWTDALALLFARLQREPNDVEALLLLGDCYLAGGAGPCARACYERTRPRRPQLIETRIRLADDLPPVARAHWLATGQVPNTPAALAERLESRESKQAEVFPPLASLVDFSEAETFVESILTAPDPALIVRGRLPEVITRLPGLLELAAERAKSEGEPGRAQALGRLSQAVRERLEPISLL